MNFFTRFLGRRRTRRDAKPNLRLIITRPGELTEIIDVKTAHLEVVDKTLCPLLSRGELDLARVGPIHADVTVVLR